MNELDLFVAAIEITDPVQRAEFLDRECASNPQMRQRIEALLSGNQVSRHPLDVRPAGELGDGTQAHAPQSITSDSPPAEHAGAVIAGKYTLVEVIGEGGMGSVWRAKQSEPVKRFVAVKLIKAGMDSKQVLARFEAERQALAVMDHPNIAKVLDGGLHEHRPYFVMELVKGVPITEYCDKYKLTPKERLELFVPVCQAIQHAHQKGIIHRDIKPSNVLIALYDDKPVVKVIDFGVAKATGATLTERTIDTGFGGVVGTPQYMSPEQATFNNLDIDTRSDVYALGVLLYELLTGSPPFSKKDLETKGLLEMLRVVREEEPPRPSTKLSTADALPSLSANRGTEPKKLTGLLRNELDWIVMKALEKDRSRRYETANGFAADINRYLAGEAVHAHPPSVGYRVRKFVRRNKGQVIAASLVLLALLTGMAGTTWGLIEARRQEREAKKQEQIARDEATEKEEARRAAAQRVMERDDALKLEAQRVTERDGALKLEALRVKERDEANDELKHRLGISNTLLAAAAYDSRDMKLTAERLEKVPAERRGWDWHYLKQQSRGGLFTLYGHSTPVKCVVFSPDGKRVVSGAWDDHKRGEVKVWDARTGNALFELKDHPNLPGINSIIRTAAFSPDGKRIITSGENKTAKVWDAETGAVLLELKGHTTPVVGVAFSRDGERIVTGGDGQPRVVTPNGIEGAQGPGELKVWDARTGKELLELKGHSGSVTSVAFSPDGTRIVSGGGDFGMPDELKVWDAKKGGKALFELNGIAGETSTVAYSPDGKWIVTGGREGTTSIVNATTGVVEFKLKGRARDADQSGYHAATIGTGVLSAAFSPDGTRIVTAGGKGDVGEAIVWDVRTKKELVDLKGHTQLVTSAAFSPDGTRIVTGSADGTVKMWDAWSGMARIELGGHGEEVPSTAISADGKSIVTGSADGAANVWDVRTGTVRLELKGDKSPVRSVSFSRDSMRILTAGGGRQLPGYAKVWDAKTGALLVELKGLKEGVLSAAFSPDGTRIVTGGLQAQPDDKGTELKVWDARKGTILFDLTEPVAHQAFSASARGWSVAFSPDGTRFVAGGGTNQKSIVSEVTVRDTLTGKVVLEFNAGTVMSVAFSPDGKRIITGGAEKSAQVWDAEKGTPLLELKGHLGAVLSASFNADSTRIVTGSYDQTAKVWDARTGTALVEIKGHSGPVHSVAFSSDGTRIVTSGGDVGKPGEAYLWDVRTGTVPPTLTGLTGTLMSVVFSPDSTRIAASSHDGSAAVGDTHTGAVLHSLPGYKGDVKMAFSLDGARIVAGDHLATKVWDVRTGKPLLELKRSQGTLLSVAYSPDGTRIVIGGHRNITPNDSKPETAVWDAQMGEKLFELKGHAEAVSRVSFSPDGSRIVTDSHDKSSKVWDAKTGQELPGEVIPKTEAEARISPDGRFFAQVHGNRVELIALKPDPDEIEYRGLQMQPKFGRYREGYLTARAAKDDFAARFYLDLVPLADRKALVAKADVDAIAPLAGLAEEHLRAGKPDLAVPLFVEMMNVKKASLGLDDPSTLETMNGLGVIYWQMGQFDKSVPMFEDLLKAREAKHGRDHMETLRAVANLGVNYKDAGKLKEAIPLLEEVQRATNKHPELRWVTGQLIDAYTKTEEHDKATNLMLENLADARKSLPKESPQLANLLAQTGLVLLEQKKWTVAEPLIRECLSIREKTQPDAWQTFNSKAQLGAALLGQKKYADAEPLLLKGYEGLKAREKTIPPPGIIRIPEALDRLIEFYTATNKPDEAKKWQAERAKYPGPVKKAPMPREVK